MFDRATSLHSGDKTTRHRTDEEDSVPSKFPGNCSQNRDGSWKSPQAPVEREPTGTPSKKTGEELLAISQMIEGLQGLKWFIQTHLRMLDWWGKHSVRVQACWCSSSWLVWSQELLQVLEEWTSSAPWRWTLLLHSQSVEFKSTGSAC